MKKKSISIIVPCFNEALGISHFINEIKEITQKESKYEFEVLFVDDGSTDNTCHLIAESAKDCDGVKIIRLTRNYGKEAALTAGLDLAKGDALIFMDADLQHPPRVIFDFLTHWEDGAYMVVGKRTSRNTDSRLYRKLAKSFYRLHNAISDVKLPEGAGDFRLIDRQVADQLKTLRENRRFMKGLFAWVGYSPVYVNYAVAQRQHGRSSFNKWRSWNFALEGITSFSTVPLRIWTYLGALVLLAGIFYAGTIIFDVLFHGVAVPGYVTLLTAIVVFGGVQLIGIGVLGEYIGRIYLESKHRPPYLVSKIHETSQKKDKFGDTLLNNDRELPN